jgi:hypothetical protein
MPGATYMVRGLKMNPTAATVRGSHAVREDVPVLQSVPVVELVVESEQPAAHKPAYSWRQQGYLPWAIGWAWRIFVGVLLCLSPLPSVLASYLGSIVVFGWLYRWMQGRILRRWWKLSRRRSEIAFHEFCAELGPDGPVSRPRWFWHEHPIDLLNRPTPSGKPAGFFRTLGRFVKIPVASIFLNVGRGIQGLLATYLITGWGVSLMAFSWYFGWMTSFNKIYEEHGIGPGLGLLGGFVLFVAGLFYTPMAQAHQAVAGGFSSFFQFRVVLRLIHARMSAYVFLAALFLIVSVILEGLRVAVASTDFPGNHAATVPEGLDALRNYLTGCTVFFFLAVLLLRGLTARIYASAVLKALGRGTLRLDEMPPAVVEALQRLDLVPAPVAPGHPLLVAGKSSFRTVYRGMLYAMLFGLWALFVARFYVGYFLVFSDFRGPLNHPLVHLPCIDSTPTHLTAGHEEEPLRHHPKF